MAHYEKTVSGSVEWYTPKWLFDKLGVEFDLDPCAPMDKISHVPAAKMWNKDDDGLAQDWKHDFFFCNPPYGRGMMDWLNKAIANGNGLLLIPARTETRVFQKALREANMVLLLGRRIAFHAGDRNGEVVKGNTAASALFAFGSKAERLLRNAKIHGTCVKMESQFNDNM